MLKTFRQWLYESHVRIDDVDAPECLAAHAATLSQKPLLRSTFAHFYDRMCALSDQYFRTDGREIELGSGAGFFRTIRPNVETSDVRIGPGIDHEIDAQQMNLPNSSVRCIYAINVFHHLPAPDRFFEELVRVLIPGGGCILIEPHGGFASAELHKRLHTDEFFDPNAKSWNNERIQGPMSGANQALAHIVFDRDIAIFEQRYRGKLELVHREYVCNGIRYLASGGLNFRQLLPSSFEPALRGLELAVKPFAQHWSLHQALVLRKC